MKKKWIIILKKSSGGMLSVVRECEEAVKKEPLLDYHWQEIIM